MSGQAVTVGGAYGPEAEAAVTAAQQAGGVAADGDYRPATMGVMRWPLDAPAGSAAPGSWVASDAPALPATG